MDESVKLVFNKKNNSLQSNLSEEENVLKEQFVQKQSIKFRHKHSSNHQNILNKYDEKSQNNKPKGAQMLSSQY